MQQHVCLNLLEAKSKYSPLLCPSAVEKFLLPPDVFSCETQQNDILHCWKQASEEDAGYTFVWALPFPLERMESLTIHNHYSPFISVRIASAEEAKTSDHGRHFLWHTLIPKTQMLAVVGKEIKQRRSTTGEECTWKFTKERFGRNIEAIAFQCMPFYDVPKLLPRRPFGIASLKITGWTTTKDQK